MNVDMHWNVQIAVGARAAC